MYWTAERVKLLRKRWLEKRSAAEIAAELGGTTRNAVIGKAYREGLSEKKNQHSDKKSTARSSKSQKRDKTTQRIGKSQAANSTKVGHKPPIEKNHQSEPIEEAPQNDSESFSVLEIARRSEQESARLNLMELTEQTCKWPIGDPSQEEFWFCGHPSEAGKPYCEAHNKIATQPFTSKSNKKPQVSPNSKSQRLPQK